MVVVLLVGAILLAPSKASVVPDGSAIVKPCEITSAPAEYDVTVVPVAMPGPETVMPDVMLAFATIVRLVAFNTASEEVVDKNPFPSVLFAFTQNDAIDPPL